MAAIRKRIKVAIGGMKIALDRFEHAWQRAEKGEAHAGEVRLSFASLPLLLRNLTQAHWTLLEALKCDGPLSINELARRLGRNYKNVHTDVSRLIELGLIERSADQRVGVAWDILTAEMRLAA